ncbi:MAG: chromate transporter [Anaerolineales bacterium]|nr:chromate transporter [Anaerolineales bacterium]
MPQTASRPMKVSYQDLFWIFFKAGMAFGGGLGILAVLEEELVTRFKVVSREDFLTYYGISRIVPSGSMTALAVAFGYRLGGFWGTIIALTAMVVPAFAITVLLTMFYQVLKNTNLLPWLEVSVLPAALALILAAAIKLGKDVFRPSAGFLLAAGAFAAVSFFKWNPALVLLAGGLLGIILFRSSQGEAK